MESILTVDMTPKVKKSDCPTLLASVIRVSNAWSAFVKAEPENQLAMRSAFLLVSRKEAKLSGEHITKLESAARMLPDAVNVRMALSSHGLHSTPIEVIRILQWELIKATAVPWPREEFDRLNSLITLDGFTSDRVKFCCMPKCRRIFWARRIATEYCPRQQCIEAYKKRQHRKKKRGEQ
jgi:hypothetical protein